MSPVARVAVLIHISPAFHADAAAVVAVVVLVAASAVGLLLSPPPHVSTNNNTPSIITHQHGHTHVRLFKKETLSLLLPCHVAVCNSVVAMLQMPPPRKVVYFPQRKSRLRGGGNAISIFPLALTPVLKGDHVYSYTRHTRQHFCDVTKTVAAVFFTRLQPNSSSSSMGVRCEIAHLLLSKPEAAVPLLLQAGFVAGFKKGCC